MLYLSADFCSLMWYPVVSLILVLSYSLPQIARQRIVLLDLAFLISITALHVL